MQASTRALPCCDNPPLELQGGADTQGGSADYETNNNGAQTSGNNDSEADTPGSNYSEADTSGSILGCCVVTLKVLGALLPPPFPSKLPARLYVGNLAVERSHQRRGIATQLLLAMERLGTRRYCRTTAQFSNDLRNVRVLQMGQGCICSIYFLYLA